MNRLFLHVVTGTNPDASHKTQNTCRLHLNSSVHVISGFAVLNTEVFWVERCKSHLCPDDDDFFSQLSAINNVFG